MHEAGFMLDGNDCDARGEMPERAAKFHCRKRTGSHKRFQDSTANGTTPKAGWTEPLQKQKRAD